MICASFDPIRIGYTRLQPSNPLRASIYSRLRVGTSSSTFQNSQIKHSGLVGRARKGSHQRDDNDQTKGGVSATGRSALYGHTHYTIIHYTWHIYITNIHDKHTQLMHTPSRQSSRFRHRFHLVSFSSSSTYRYPIRSTNRSGSRAADRVQCISIQS